MYSWFVLKVKAKCSIGFEQMIWIKRNPLCWITNKYKDTKVFNKSSSIYFEKYSMNYPKIRF